MKRGAESGAAQADTGSTALGVPTEEQTGKGSELKLKSLPLSPASFLLL